MHQPDFNPMYAQAIDLLLSPSTDLRAIAISLAKVHPAIFVGLATMETPPAWHATVHTLLVKGEKIPAIKQIRDNAGVSLLEAKDISEHIALALYQTGQTINCPWAVPRDREVMTMGSLTLLDTLMARYRGLPIVNKEPEVSRDAPGYYQRPDGKVTAWPSLVNEKY